MSPDRSIVLASGSPRRLELLTRIGIDVVVEPADVDESELPGESARDYVVRVALNKAHKVARDKPGSVVIAADTSVVLDGRVLGKPSDQQHARAMLTALSGRAHEVLTAVVVVDSYGTDHTAVVSARVTFGDLDPGEIDWYISTGEPFDKAGGYGLQGIGEFMVERIEGSPSTVVGLPLRPTIDLLRTAGIRWPPEPSAHHM